MMAWIGDGKLAGVATPAAEASRIFVTGPGRGLNVQDAVSRDTQ